MRNDPINCTNFSLRVPASPDFKAFYLFFRRKKAGRMVHKQSEKAKKLRGIKAKLYNKQRFKEKVQMRKL